MSFSISFLIEIECFGEEKVLQNCKKILIYFENMSKSLTSKRYDFTGEVAATTYVHCTYILDI